MLPRRLLAEMQNIPARQIRRKNNPGRRGGARITSQSRRYKELKVLIADEQWYFDTLPEFLAAIPQSPEYYFYVVSGDAAIQLQVNYYSNSTTVWGAFA
jgi:hypothetical protein